VLVRLRNWIKIFLEEWMGRWVRSVTYSGG